MAGDWIKIEHGLPQKPEVMQLAETLQISETEVVGHLVQFWIWCDLNLSRNCPDTKGTRKGLDRVSGRDGFVDAMVSVGWLELDSGTDPPQIRIPNYGHHLSQSAKTRALAARKKQQQRADMSPKVSRSCPDNRGTKQGTKRGTREEKRREDNKPNGLSPLYVPPDDSDDEQQPQCPAQRIVDKWNRTWGKNMRLTDKRRKALRARWNDPWWRENWELALQRARQLPFCNGDNDREWTATLDWFLYPDTCTKILEGDYDGSRTTARDPGRAELERNRANIVAGLRIAAGQDIPDQAASENAAGSGGAVAYSPFGFLSENANGSGATDHD